MIRGEVDDAGYSAKFCHKNRMPSGYPAVKSRNVVYGALSWEELAFSPSTDQYAPAGVLLRSALYGHFCHRNLHADLPNKAQVLLDESDACAAVGRGRR
jgi:hypothetical protein